MATYGADPELFLRDKRTGNVASAVGLIGGTKGKPVPMEGLPRGYGMQEDNVMVEFNVPPATSQTRFDRSISRGLGHITELVRTSLTDFEVDVGACARLFTTAQLSSKQAKVFGCSPDYNAHEQGQACPSISPEHLIASDGVGEWRFAGGHVHIGYENPHGVPDFVVAALADVYLGLRSVGRDRQGKRRALYGTAGRYRPTSYGIEYRTLSNFWIWDQDLTRMISESTGRLLNRLHTSPAKDLQTLYAEIPWIDVQDAINTENNAKAADLLVFLNDDLVMEV